MSQQTAAEGGSAAQDPQVNHETNEASRKDGTTMVPPDSTNAHISIKANQHATMSSATPSSTAAADWDNSAACRVFETPELCEMILSSVKPIEILRTRQLSTHFSRVIYNSVTLMRMIFLSPTNAGPSGNAPFRDARYGYRDGGRNYDAPYILNLVQRNPFVFDGVNTSWSTGALSLKQKFEEYIMSDAEDLPGGEMFITNPPVKSVHFSLGDYEVCDDDIRHMHCAWGERTHVSHLWKSCFHVPVGGIATTDGVKVKHLVEFLQWKLSVANADGERRFTIQDCIVQLPVPFEVVGDETDQNAPGIGQMSYAWM
ncbi:unnamed protein product [Zymoseptoria tritici ST99CH_3D1]|nr:unnamed protein product [Zymoseptoria tritici ST99CH_3D1]